MTAVRAITFDLDDTLWPMTPVLLAAERELWQWLADECPRVVSEVGEAGFRALRDRVFAQRTDLQHDMSAMRLETLRLAMRAARYDSRHAQAAYEVFFAVRNQVTFFADVEPTLTHLRGRYAMGSITNGNADVALVGLDKWLSVEITAGKTGVSKPAPEIFAAASSALDIPPDAILHVGDHPEQDANAARNAGFRAVWLNRDDQAWPGPNAQPPTIRSLAELPDLMAAL